MRSISTADNLLFTKNGGRATYLRVDVQDSGSTFRDLTTYPRTNMVISAQWGETIDDEGQHGSIVLKREQEQLSLAPLMTKSPLNLGWTFGGTYAALIQVGRGVRIYTADIPSDAKPISTDWRFMFDGYIDSVDAGQDETIVLEVSDLQGRLRDTWIEVERVYGYAMGANATKGCRLWTSLMSTVAGELMIPTDANRNGHFYSSGGGTSVGSPEPTWPTGSGSTVADGSVTWTEKGNSAAQNVWQTSLTVAVGDLITPTAANANGHSYVCSAITTGITSGTTEPTWPTGAGVTVTDAGVTWKENGAQATAVETIMGQIVTDNGLTVPSGIQIPGGSPNWSVKWFLQQRQSVWDALRALADQIGWDLRFLWDSGSNTFLLSLTTPNRSKSTPDRTFGPGEKWKVNGLKADLSSIRNVVQVIFSASGSQDPSGNPLRITLSASDSASIAKYGRRFMEFGEASTSNIDTSAEATTMASAALADLKEPNFTKQVDLPYFPFAQLGDLYRFSADGVYADGNLDLAVTGYQHNVPTDGLATTTFTCSGKPATGSARWLAQSGNANGDDIHRQGSADSNVTKITAAAVVGGTLLKASTAFQKLATGQDLEWHIGTSSGFTPDNTTIVQGQGGNQITVPHLIPAAIYFAKIVPVRRNGSKIYRGMPSAAFQFTAGQAAAGHIQGGIALGWYPINGGFETRTDSNGMPDHWTILSPGVLGTDVIVKEDSSGMSGNRYLRLGTKIGGIKSALVPLLNEHASLSSGSMYRMSWWRKAKTGNTAGASYSVLVSARDVNDAEVDVYTAGSGLPCDNKLDTWVKEEVYVELAPADPSARGLRIEIVGNGASATLIMDIDEFRIEYIGTVWYAVGGGGTCDNGENVPGFDVGWSNFGGNYAPISFRKDQFGMIHLRGIATKAAGGIGTSIFTLPLGYRPALGFWRYFDRNGSQFDIRDTGAVTPQAAPNPPTHCLDGIFFRPGSKA